MSMLPILPGQPGYQMDPIFSQQVNVPAPSQKKGGMFGGGLGGALGQIAGTMGDYFLQRSGMQPMYGPQMAQQRMLKQQEEQYQRQRQDGMADWQAKQQWQLEHTPPPQPTQTDRYLGEYLDPNTPQQRRAALGQILFPPVMSTVNGMPAIIDRAQMVSGVGSSPAPAVQPGYVEDGFRFKGGNPGDPNAWEPVGGPTPQASGGFPGY